MVDSFVQLPDDSPNTGKKVRTHTETIAGSDVYTHVFVPAIDQGGSDTPVSATNPLPITGAISGSVTVSGSITANAGTNLNTSALALESGGNLAAIATSLAIIDDWDESDRAKVNPIAGQVGVQGGSGTVSALTQRVVLATDVALPTGSNAIGKLAANDGVDIGDVTINNSTGASAVNIQDGGNSITVDGSVSATVTNAGTFAVQDSQVIVDNAGFNDGTSKLFMGGYIFDESAGTALTENDAAAARVNANRAQVFVLEDDTIRGRRATVTALSALKVDGSAVTQPVSIAATVTVDSELPAAAALADNTSNPTVPGVGAFLMAWDGSNWDRVQTGAATGGALKVDGSAVTQPVSMTDPVFVDDAAYTVASSKALAIAYHAVAHGSAPDAADAGDAVNPITNRHRVPFVIGGHPNLTTTEFHFTAAQTDVKLVTVSSGTKIVVTAASAMVSGAGTVNVGVRIGLAASTLTAVSSSGVSGMVLSHGSIPPGSGYERGNGDGMLAVGGDGDDLIITCGAATGGNLRITITYYTIES